MAIRVHVVHIAAILHQDVDEFIVTLTSRVVQRCLVERVVDVWVDSHLLDEDLGKLYSVPLILHLGSVEGSILLKVLISEVLYINVQFLDLVHDRIDVA